MEGKSRKQQAETMSDKQAPNSLLGKRKRKKDSNPNPLFSQWLAEWRDEAKEKGWKSEFIYSKALASLKKYPLSLSTGKECKVLQHFGDKICKMIDDRLLKLKQEQEQATSVADFDTGFSSASWAVHPRLPVPVHEISDTSDEDAGNLCHPKSIGSSHSSVQANSATHLRMRTVEKKHLGQTSSRQQMGLDSRNTLETVDVDDDVSIIDQTSPVKLASLHSESDDEFPELPRLPDLDDGHRGDLKVKVPAVRTLSVNHTADVGAAVTINTGRVTHSASDSDGDEAGQVVPPQRAGGRGAGRPPRQYVPAPRSGPYAVLLALYTHAQDPNFQGFMSKAELCGAAQPFADKSFTVPDPGGRYTAWSSVSTLVRKGYLTKESSPAKYRLTDEGYELAHRLEEVQRRGAEGRQQNGGGGPDHGEVTGRNGDISDPHITDCGTKTTQWADGPGNMTSQTKTAVQKKELKTLDLRCKDAASSSSSSSSAAGGGADDVHSGHRGGGEAPWRVQQAEDCIVVDHCEADDDASDGELPALTTLPPPLAERLKLSSTSPSALAQSAASRRLQYWYVAEDDQLVSRKDQACVQIDEAGVSFLVKMNYQHLLQSDCQYKLDMTRRLGDDFVFAYLADMHCYDEAQPPGQTEEPSALTTAPTTAAAPHSAAPHSAAPHSAAVVRSSTASLNRRPVHNISDSDSEDDPVSAISDDIPSIPRPSSPASRTSAKSVGVCNRAPPSGVHWAAAGNHGAGTTGKTAAQSTGAGVSKFPKVPSFSGSENGMDSGKSLTSNAVQDFVLWPGTFDVVLYVDNREFYGSQSSSKSLVPDLLKNGVGCELQLLNVGDLLWVARERDPVTGGRRPGGAMTAWGEAAPPRRELVLNYVVERKRMDDLASSIVGGRLKEQKFRLKHSGLQEKIILIESYGSMQHFSISEDRIKQAISNTEIIDGFTVKQTGDSKETAAYLTLMTRYLQSYYQNKTLRSCSRDTIKELGLRFDISDTEQMLMPFDHFNQASMKNKPLTVRELFAKQLIQLWGMSAEKAKAIVERYPTPTRLIGAYAACTPEEGDSLLATLKFGKNLRNLGKALSKQVAQLYTSKTLT